MSSWRRARRPSLQLYRRLLVRYLRPQLGQTLLLPLVLCINILLQLTNPLIMRRFLDSALAGSSMELLTRLALLFIGIAAVQQVAAVSSTVLAENVGWRATNSLRRDLARHIAFPVQRKASLMLIYAWNGAVLRS